MKYIFFISAMVMLLVACNGAKKNQTNFSVKGTFDSSIQTDSVFLYLPNTRQELDIIASAPVVNGKFELNGSIDQPREAVFMVHKNGELAKSGTILLENAGYTYSREGDRIKIKGGKLHDIVLGFESSEEYYNAVADYENTMSRFFVDGKETVDDLTPEERAKIDEKFNAGINMENGILAKIIDNPQTPVLAKAFAISRVQDWERYPVEKRIELLDGYLKDPTVADNKEIIAMREGYEEDQKKEAMAQTVAAGSSFKDIEAKDVNGKVIKLSEIVAKNKFTILEFWASWCSPCRGEIPNLKKAHEKYKSKGLEIYSISIDEDNAKWLKALEEEGHPAWINVISEGAFEGENVKAYGLTGVPSSFLIGQDGVIRATHEELRGKDLDKTLSKHLK